MNKENVSLGHSAKCVLQVLYFTLRQNRSSYTNSRLVDSELLEVNTEKWDCYLIRA